MIDHASDARIMPGADDNVRRYMADREQIPRGSWILTGNSIVKCTESMLSCVDPGHTLDEVSVTQRRRLDLPAQEFTTRLMILVDTFLKHKDLIFKSLQLKKYLTVENPREPFVYYYHTQYNLEYFNALFKEPYPAPFVPESAVVAIRAAMARILRGGAQWSKLSDDLHEYILSLAIDSPEHVLMWSGYMNNIPSLRDYALEIAQCAVKVYRRPIEGTKLLKCVQSLKSIETKWKELQPCGIGPYNNYHKANTIVVCPKPHVDRIVACAGGLGKSAVSLFEVSSSVDNFRHYDVVVCCPVHLASVRHLQFHRVIMCVFNHAFYIHALPFATHRWICKRPFDMVSTRESQYLNVDPSSWRDHAYFASA
jgi:hypothetical protein